MAQKMTSNLIINEEKQALKIYLLLFYLTYFLYNYFYHYIYQQTLLHLDPKPVSLLSGWMDIIFIGLLPISLFLVKKGKDFYIKYMYIVAYTVAAIIGDTLVYFENPSEFASGNAVEFILVLFSPIFINKRFYWISSILSLLRYILVGIIIKSQWVVFPIVLFIILAVIAYILLNRFISYINAINSSNEKLRHREKLAFVGQMATSLGHEIKNPLASLKGFTQLQMEKYPGDQQYYSIMEQEIERINSIVNDLMVIGKPRSTNFQKNNLKEIIAYVISITKQLACDKKITLAAVLDDDLPLIECDENQFKQVFINLINNGIESMADGGTLKIQTNLIAKKMISISVVDQGSGIEQAEIDRLFEPFYTTKPEGTGLGLMVTKKIVEDHQGDIQVRSEIGSGTTVTITLPTTQK